ncbi:MAG: S8 family serine peptidase [Hyphomicrobiaceae bacterium]
MMKRPLTVLLGIFAICLSGPITMAPPFGTAALADDDDGGGGFRGFGGAGRVLRAAPRVLRGLTGMSRPSYSRKRRAKKPQAIAPGTDEIVVVGLATRDVDRLVSLGFTALGQRPNSTFGSTLTRLRVPTGKTMARAIETVAMEVPGASVAQNDRYGPLSRVVYHPSGESCGARCEAFELTAWTTAAARCTARSRIGIVDTAADLSHPSIDRARIVSKVFRSPDRAPSDTLHGTAVLSLLVGEPDSAVIGVAHGAEILHADAFHGVGEDSRTDVFDLLSAIDWLISSDVQVLNLSFSGPNNPLLHRAILAAQNKKIHVIAAAGRPDRAKISGYPARYDGVIAVAAVDGRLRPSRLSMRGGHVAFAAPGVGLTVAHGKDGLRNVDGTSFAAPFVAAAYAMSSGEGADVTRSLADGAQDLGASGRDPTYGWGLLQYSAVPGC